MDAKEILRFNAIRKLVVQYKRYLDLLGDLKSEKDASNARLSNALEKVQAKLDEAGVPIDLSSYTDQSDWFDDDKYQRLRKQVLDLGNDLKRELENEFDKYEIRI